MKNVFSAFVLTSLLLPLQSYALQFSADTVFLTTDNRSDCEAQGGYFTEWAGEIFCTKAPDKEAFYDVAMSHPHTEAIAYVQEQGLVSGYLDGSFKPDNTINRVELLKIVLPAGGETWAACTNYQPYTDEVVGAWYETYLQGATCSGLIGGYPDGSVKPANPVLLTEAAKIISNRLTPGVETSTGGSWYAPFINNLASKGALPTTISGVSAELTRGQMAEIIYRLKTGKTSLPSHTLTSLESNVGAAASAETDAEIDGMFDDIFNQDGLDLDSLLDF